MWAVSKQQEGCGSANSDAIPKDRKSLIWHPIHTSNPLLTHLTITSLYSRSLPNVWSWSSNRRGVWTFAQPCQLKVTIPWICETVGPPHLIPYTSAHLIPYRRHPPIKSSTESRTAIIFAKRHKARPAPALVSLLAISKLRSRFLHRCGIFAYLLIVLGASILCLFQNPFTNLAASSILHSLWSFSLQKLSFWNTMLPNFAWFSHLLVYHRRHNQTMNCPISPVTCQRMIIVWK